MTNAPKPRLTGASGDSLGSGVSDRVQATRRSVQMLATGHWVVGRSGRYGLLVAYMAFLGVEFVVDFALAVLHEAVVDGYELNADRAGTLLALAQTVGL